MNRIGIIAPASQVPKVELSLGVKQLEEAGFKTRVHAQCKKSHLFFSGTDEERAKAFYEFAKDPDLCVLWYARGGYGTVRLLPILDRLVSEHGVPQRKLLAGYSDATALLDYVRTRWNWEALHAPMPGLRNFMSLSRPEWDALRYWIKREFAPGPWTKTKLKFFHMPQGFQKVEAPMIGGNLSVITSLIGTRYALDSRNKILFLEEVDEILFRVDRMVQQLKMSESLKNVRAIVLGNFLNCRDAAPMVLKAKPADRILRRVMKTPKPSELKPLRKTYATEKLLGEIFGELGRSLDVPVVHGFPSGHGPEHAPVPLGAEYRLDTSGKLDLTEWRWFE